MLKRLMPLTSFIVTGTAVSIVQPDKNRDKADTVAKPAVLIFLIIKVGGLL